MTRTPRLNTILAGLAGGLVVLAIGALLLATGAIGTTETTREVVQQPIGSPAPDGDDGDGLTVNDIYRRTAPGVVSIRATGGTDRSPFGPPQEGQVATGSGFVVDGDGLILTNAHVVEGSDDVEVRFGESAPVKAEVVGQDPSTDLAVLDVDMPRSRLRPLELGDSDSVRVGDPAIAIGNQFGFLDRTVTTGIVSAKQRQINAPNGFSIDNVIQTDAAVNPGSSGGPLLDGAGRVVGINSSIATGGSRGSVGIAFAVPVNTAKQVIPELKEHGKIDRAYLGVTTAPVTEVAGELDLPVDHGALVQEVQPGTPADRAGLRAGRTQTPEGLRVGGDLIVRVDGREVREPQDIAAAIADDKPGESVEVTFFRGKSERTVSVELAKRPASAGGGPGGGGPGGDDAFPFP